MKRIASQGFGGGGGGDFSCFYWTERFREAAALLRFDWGAVSSLWNYFFILAKDEIDV